jgi:PAS domain S-box-containing protein
MSSTENRRITDSLFFIRKTMSHTPDQDFHTEKFFESLLDKSPDGIMITRGTKICYANPALNKIIGFDETRDLTGEDSLQQISPEYRNLVKHRAVARQRGEAVPQKYDIKVMKVDGSLVDMEVSASVITYHDEPASLIIIRDVTERKEMEEKVKKSEAELQAIYESVGTTFGIILVDRDCRVVKTNRRAEEEFGEITNRLCYEVLKKRDSPCRDCLAIQVLKGGQPVISEETYLPRDGTSKVYTVSAMPLRQKEGDIDFVLLSLLDITEKKLYEQRFQQGEKMQALGVLASGVAHDFNNILGSILTRTELLLEFGKDLEKIKSGLEIIRKTVLDGTETVNRLRHFTRRRSESSFNRVDLNRVIRDVLEVTEPLWKHRAEEKGIRYRVQTRFGEVPAVLGHHGELRDVVMNLVHNAVEAMPEGGDISVSTRLNNNFTEMTFRDTGPGIEEGVMLKIFDPFFTTKGSEASGLGLSACYTIISNHKGTIEARNGPSGGAVFTIALPAAEADGDEAAEGDESTAPRAVKEYRILVIEDEEDIRVSLLEYLALEGHRVDAVSNGDEGMAAFRKKPYDVVITDIGIPRMSGWEVSKAIKEMNPGVRIILITGWGIKEKDRRVEESRADILLQKPFKLQKIKQILTSF